MAEMKITLRSKWSCLENTARFEHSLSDEMQEAIHITLYEGSRTIVHLVSLQALLGGDIPSLCPLLRRSVFSSHEVDQQGLRDVNVVRGIPDIRMPMKFGLVDNLY